MQDNKAIIMIISRFKLLRYLDPVLQNDVRRVKRLIKRIVVDPQPELLQPRRIVQQFVERFGDQRTAGFSRVFGSHADSAARVEYVNIALGVMSRFGHRYVASWCRSELLAIGLTVNRDRKSTRLNSS